MITGDIFRDAVISAANNILNNSAAVNKLNVFPVPDGDTGTNMSLTIGAALPELLKSGDKPLSDTAKTTSGALLRGARGNSGVILSLIFRGMSKGFAGSVSADGALLAEALKKGTKSAYGAVMKPTEGTMLTVVREAAEAAEVAVKGGKTDFIEVFEIILTASKESLARTPELLPVLKKAGVVDAGGEGLIKIFEGMMSVFRDGIIIQSDLSPSAPPAEDSSVVAEFDGEITFCYCTEFLVNKAEDLTRNPVSLRRFLETLGDSVVLVDDEDIIKVHVHTNDPGKALQEALKYGSLTSIKIENMIEQQATAKQATAKQAVAKAASENGASAAPAEEDNGEYTPVEPKKEYGFVTVAAGAGLQELFLEMGADNVVSGGQTMNPSTQDILRAVELTPAKCVFVLPNNKNIIMAAEQTRRLATRKVVVLPTKSVPMGIGAMLAFDEDGDCESNIETMQNAAENVHTGMITFAARDSDFDGHKIKEGELLALIDGKLSFTAKDLGETVLKLAESLCKEDSEFVTLIYGEDVEEESAKEVQKLLEGALPNDIEVTVIPGGQPVYYYIIGVE